MACNHRECSHPKYFGTSHCAEITCPNYKEKCPEDAIATTDEENGPFEWLPIHRTEAGYPNCSTCDGGGCLDCTDPA